MMMRHFFIALSLCVLMISSVVCPAMAQQSEPLSPLQIQSSSQRVPAGTKLQIAFNSAMDSRITEVGEPFTASLLGDLMVTSSQSGTQKVILPRGTLIRGRVDSVKRPGLFSRGGAITLNFDHVVTASGDLMPLDLNLSAENKEVKQFRGTHQLALYSDPGIGKKVRQGAQSGYQTFSKITDEGIEAGKNVAGGAGVLVTAPLGVIGGALGGAAVTTGKAAQAIFGRGDSISIKPGDKIFIDFGNAAILQTQ